MKTLVTFNSLVSIVPNGISTDLLEALCSIYPKGRTGSLGHAFRATLPFSDPRVAKIEGILNDASYRRWDRLSESLDHEYVYQLSRVYDTADLKAAELLELHPPSEAGVHYEWRRSFDTQLAVGKPSRHAIITVARHGCYAVKDDAKKRLDTENLRGVVFKPAITRYSIDDDEDDDDDLPDNDDVWWELTSDIVLPPLAPSMTLLHEDNTPFKGDFRKGCKRREGYYNHAELHYRRADIDAVGPFDLALTHEMFGGLPNQFDRLVVVSQRFYQACVKHRVKTGFIPVRIDEN